MPFGTRGVVVADARAPNNRSSTVCNRVAGFTIRVSS